MREIKYRAWVSNLNKFVYGITVYPSGATAFHHPETNYNVEIESKFVQQFTGLKDKNGREIYEGDIIKGPQDFGPGGWHERTGIVDFHEFHGYSWEYWDIKEIEVIGNIFESPELCVK